jgi:putative DNA primase/helicase
MTHQKTTEELERELNRKFLDDVRALTKPLTPDSAPVKYLNSRGIKEIPATIRLLPEYKQQGKYYQCLIARLDDKDGNRVSYKIIHLNDDGTKADVPVVKKTLPCERSTDGMAVRLFKADKQLAVCEGIETALAFHQDNGIPTWALDNAQNMKKFVPPTTVEQLIIVADMDSSFTGQASAYELARKFSNLLNNDCYALKSVNVYLIINNSIIIDSGQKIDYLNILD